MLGYLRSEISSECGISTGAVSSIVDAWKRSTGLEVASLIRDIGVTLRSLGISPSQCATGLRISKLVERMGLDESSIESFLSEIFPKFQELGVNPTYFTKYISGLISLLEGGIDEQRGALSIRGIDSIFEKRRLTKFELEEEIKRLESKLLELRTETSFSERNLEELTEKKRSLESDLNWKANLRAELEKHGLDVNNPSILLKAARYFEESGFTIEEMLGRFSSFKGMENAILGQAQQVEISKKRNHDLEEMIKSQDEILAERRLKNRQLDELKQMGFGLWELKVLRNLVTELAVENSKGTENGKGIENAALVKGFISDMESHYPDYLRLRDRISEMKTEESNFRTLKAAVGHLGPAISAFLHRNPSQDDIREVIEVIEGYPKAAATNSPLNRDQGRRPERGVDRPLSSEEEQAGTDPHEVDRPRKTIPEESDLGIQVDNSEEDLTSVLSSLYRKYASLPHVQELDDTSTSLSNLESVETDLKKKSTRIRPPDPLRLPPTKADRDEHNGSNN